MKRIVYSFLSVLIIAAFAPFLVGQQLAAPANLPMLTVPIVGHAAAFTKNLFRGKISLCAAWRVS